MTETVATPARPPAPKGALPSGVVLSRYWRETNGGPLLKHEHDRPIDEDTDMPTGLWWMCPEPACKVGEWVFANRETGEAGRPKRRGCPDHVRELLPGVASATADDPKTDARNWLQRRLAEKTAEARRRAADAAAARLAAVRQAGRNEAARIGSDLRAHIPSGAASLTALVGDYALLEQMGPLEGAALGAGIAVGGALLAYLAVYVGELIYARRMGYTIRELPREVRSRARSHARWIASGVLATGVWLVIAELAGADLSNWQGLLMSLLAAILIGVVNYRPWAAMVEHRKAQARARIAAAEAAARAEEERLAAIEAERDRQRKEAEDQRRAAEEAAVAEAKKIVTAEDDRITAGRKFANRWNQIAAAAKGTVGPGFEIWRTRVLPEETRKLTAIVDGEKVVVGHEFLVRAEPGVLAPRAGTATSPFVQMKTWLCSMLELDTGMLDLAYQPKRLVTGESGGSESLINHGLVTLFDSHPLGKNVNHPGPSGCYIDDKGTRWGFAGRDLRGNAVHRRMWTPGQAGGGIRVGVTGMGKSVVTQVSAYNDLILGILPIIHDAGKNGMDFINFYGIFPVGHTVEHREVIRESLWAEMKRRQAWINVQTAEGLGGMEVAQDPQWDPERGGPPIRCTWEEFHMHMKDPKFVQYFGSQVRLQRATAMFAEGASQGSGLADWGDQQVKENMAEIMLQMMRVSDHTARLSGYKGGIMPSSLPSMPGMMVMQELGGDPVSFRSAFIPRDPLNPESLIYRLKQPNGTPEGQQILFAPELPDETIAVFQEHGLMDLWELGKTKSGREQLQSEADPVESTVYPPAMAAMFAQAAQAQGPATKPRLRAEDVVLAMLAFESDAGRPGLTQQEMLTSPWWKQVDGEWAKNTDGVPAHTTIMRACNRMMTVTEAQEQAGAAPLIGNDGAGKGARWCLLAAGIERGEQMLTLLRSAGVLGQHEKAQARATAGMDVAALERQAMLEAEQAALISELVREAAGLGGGQ